MSPAELDALEALLGKATPGNWVARDDIPATVDTDHAERPEMRLLVAEFSELGVADAELTATLRNAAPQLIASARALESLRTAVAEYRVDLASVATADPWDDGANYRWEKAAGRLADATLALFPEET